MNSELYQVPTFSLLVMLVAVFVALCARTRARRNRPGVPPAVWQRHLLWLAGWIFAVIRLALEIWSGGRSGAGLAFSSASMEMVPLMFLGSFAPQLFLRRRRIPYVAVFAGPLILFAAVHALDPRPGGMVQGLLFVCVLADIYVAGRWSLERQMVPAWLALLIVGGFGAGCIWFAVRQQYTDVLELTHSGILLMTTLLVTATFARLTPGVVFTVGALAFWTAVPIAHLVLAPVPVPATMVGMLNLAKIVAAVGMIVLVLEDEVASNLAAQQRDRRARIEMEKYTSLYMADMALDEESRDYYRVCETIAEVSRFRQAAVFVSTTRGWFRMAGHAGMDGALAGALEALGRRTTEEVMAEVARGEHFTLVAGHLILMDLQPLMAPGDELEQMNFRRAYLMGIRTRDARLAGVLLLAGLRRCEEPLLTEDVLPLELLVARLGAAREHLALLRRLMHSERLAGLGQLARGVAHELNNPLTAVTGFAQLLVESEGANHEHAGVILNEARRMKAIIDSLMRFRHSVPAERTAVPLDLVLRDIQELARHDLEKARIELCLNLRENLPLIRADGEQMRQVFLQLIRNAIGSLEHMPEDQGRRITIEAAAIPHGVEVMVSDTGPGFAEPGRAFDPYFTTRHPGEGIGLGLSICFAIVREHGGEISAVNLESGGAAVVIELPAYDPDRPQEAAHSPLADNDSPAR